MANQLNYKTLLKNSEKLEKQFIKTLKDDYIEAKTKLETEINKFAKYTIDGKFDPVEMQKYNRLQSLIKQADNIIKDLNAGRVPASKDYLTDVYMINSNGVAEQIQRVTNLSFSQVDRKAIRNSVLTPLDEIALQDNADVVRAKIRRDITQSIIQGSSIPETAKLINNSLETNLNDAVKIARTEMTGVMNNARLQRMEEAEVKGIKLLKEWVATSDDRTRDRHSMRDGERVPIDKPFSGGLMYPGDQAGEASDVINCRCTIITIVE